MHTLILRMHSPEMPSFNRQAMSACTTHLVTYVGICMLNKYRTKTCSQESYVQCSKLHTPGTTWSGALASQSQWCVYLLQSNLGTALSAAAHWVLRFCWICSFFLAHTRLSFLRFCWIGCIVFSAFSLLLVYYSCWNRLAHELLHQCHHWESHCNEPTVWQNSKKPRQLEAALQKGSNRLT